MVFHPKVLFNIDCSSASERKGNADAHNAAAKSRPRIRTRIVRVSVGKAGIGGPHDALKLQELG